MAQTKSNQQTKKGEPKGSPKKYDYTSTKRGQKRTALDNAWAEMVSGGKYKTLRNLMRAIHAKEYALAETRPTPLALDEGDSSAPKT